MVSAVFQQSEALLEDISLQSLHHVLRFGLDLFNTVKKLTFDRQFHLGEQEKFIGPVSREVEVTVVFVAANNCRMTSDTLVGELS